MQRFCLLRNRQCERQICRSNTTLYSAVLFCAGIFIGGMLLGVDSVMRYIVIAITLVYGVLVYRNDRMSYDSDGITLYSVWGKPFYISWNNVLKIEIWDEPLISKQLFVGRVLRISLIENQGRKTTCRFPYQYYIGIEAFLSYYAEHVSKNMRHCHDSLI